MAQLAKADEKNFADLLQSHSHQISKALGDVTGGALDKFLMSTMNLIRQTPKLLECDQFSMLNAIREAATLSLSLDPNMGEASIVPFKKVAKLIPGYRGLIKLATRSGHVSHMQARIFYRNEYESGSFQYEEGTNPSIHHIPMPPSERGDRMGSYSVAKLTNGDSSFDLMWAEDVERIKKKAPGAGFADSAWNTDEDEMWRKSVVRRHIKYLNISNDMGDAVGTAVKDEYFDAGIVPDVPITPPRATKQIEQGEQNAEVVEDAPVQKKQSSGKKGKGKAQKDSPSEPPGGRAASGQDAGTTETGSGTMPETHAGEEDGSLSMFPPEDDPTFSIKVKIRELAEVMALDKDKVDADILNCKDDPDKLNALRLRYVKEYNESLQK